MRVHLSRPDITDREIQAVVDVLKTPNLSLGPKLPEFEQAFADYIGTSRAVAVNSGTSALYLCLLAMGVGPGDEVITTPFTFFATGGCIARTGAKPVFVDIDEKTYNIDPASIESAITDKTKAILPVHLFGQMADMDPIMAIAGAHSLAVVEDACQSISSTYKGKKAGSIGTAGCFSFFPSKNLGAIGDGGMTVTNDEKLSERLKVMRNHGQTGVYEHALIGGNFRLDPIQAAALLVKLPHLDNWSAGRRKNAAYYNKKFSGTSVQTPYISDDCVSIYNQYVIRVPRRDEVLAHLRASDIGCAVYYPMSLHLQECFASLGYKQGDFPNAEKASAEVMALPVYPELTDEMKDFVVETILTFLD